MDSNANRVRAFLLGLTEERPTAEEHVFEQERENLLAERRRKRLLRNHGLPTASMSEIATTATLQEQLKISEGSVETVSKASRKNWLMGTAVAIATVLVLFVGLRSVDARRNYSNQIYASRFLSSVLDLFCEDLEVLNEFSSQSEKLLPNTNGGWIGSSDWIFLHSFSRSSQSLLSTHIGHYDIALSQLASAEQTINKSGDVPDLQSVELLLKLCNAKVGFDIRERVGAGGVSKIEETALSTAVNEITIIEDFEAVIQQLEFSSAELGIADGYRALLLAGLRIDLGRARLKLGGRLNETTSEKEIELNYDGARAEFERAALGLDQFESERDSLWWSLKFRLLGNSLLLANREFETRNAERAETRLRDLAQEVADLELELISTDMLTSASRYRTSLLFEVAVCHGNLADALYDLSSDSQPFADDARQSLSRQRAIELLELIPSHARTVRHRENLALNVGRLLKLKVRAAVGGAKSDRPVESLRIDASKLEFLIGDLLDGITGQVLPDQRLLAAILLESSYKKNRLEEFVTQNRFRITDEDEALAAELRGLLRTTD